MTFIAIPQALEGGEGKWAIIYRCYTNVKFFYSEKRSKFCSSPNVESYLHMRKNNIGGRGAVFRLSCNLRKFTSVQTGRAKYKFDPRFNSPNTSNDLKHCCKCYRKCVCV